MSLERLCDEIASRLESGESVSGVEAELIACADGIDEDERAALWLFAWSYEHSCRRTTHSHAHHRHR